MAHHLDLLSICQRGISTRDTTNSTNSAPSRGWVSSPDGRGTLDIVWACLLTTFLCTWSSLHLNVPGGQDTWFKHLVRKIRWTIQAFLAPEFVVFLATIQKIEARRSCKEWKEAGYSFWTVQHGFFANMGGFLLQPRDSKAFPVNSKQLLYLVTHDYTCAPSITQFEISQKSQQDGFQRFLTLLQLSWFVLQCIGRGVQHLPTTTLELATIGLVICAFTTYYEWSSKPLDVEYPVIIQTEADIARILIEAGERASKPYLRTPLDFIEDQFPLWLTRIEPYITWRIFSPPERPLPRFTNDRLPAIDGSRDSVLLVAVVTAYSSLHFAAWNFSFPTQVERLVWRIVCIIMVSTASIFFACEFYRNEQRNGRWQRWKSKFSSSSALPVARALPLDRAPRTPEDAKRVPPVPTWQVVNMLVVTVLYTSARLYVAVECFMGLRSLPPGAFDSVEWSNVIPHF